MPYREVRAVTDESLLAPLKMPPGYLFCRKYFVWTSELFALTNRINC